MPTMKLAFAFMQRTGVVLAEVATFERANAVQKTLRRLAASGPGAWLFARVLHRIDRPVYRLTRGRHTFANLLSGIPVVLLTTTEPARGGHEPFRCSGCPPPTGSW